MSTRQSCLRSRVSLLWGEDSQDNALACVTQADMSPMTAAMLRHIAIKRTSSTMTPMHGCALPSWRASRLVGQRLAIRWHIRA